MIALSPHQRYFLYKGFTDMRKSFDGLCGLVRNELDKDPASGCVFIFFNKPRTHVKILFWERDGFALFYKRLERGTFEVPSSNHENEISSQTLSLILDGIILSSVKKKKRYLHPV
jgi:transposase